MPYNNELYNHTYISKESTTRRVSLINSPNLYNIDSPLTLAVNTSLENPNPILLMH